MICVRLPHADLAQRKQFGKIKRLQRLSSIKLKLWSNNSFFFLMTEQHEQSSN